MRFLKKNILVVFLLAGIFSAQGTYAQDHGETRKHKRMWFRFRLKKHPDAFNPSVSHGKSTHAESRRQKKEDAAVLKEQKRQYKRWQKKSKRKAGVK